MVEDDCDNVLIPIDNNEEKSKIKEKIYQLSCQLYKQTLEFLISNGADINDIDYFGVTALQNAKKYYRGNITEIQILFDAKWGSNSSYFERSHE